MATEIIAKEIESIETEIVQNQDKLKSLSIKIDESKKKKAELEKKKNDIEKISGPYKKLLEDVGKAKENIESQSKKKRALIDLEFKDDEEKKKSIKSNIENAIKKVDDRIKAAQIAENTKKQQMKRIEGEIEELNEKIINYDSLKNYPKTIKIDEDLKIFTDLMGKLEKEQILSRSCFLLNYQLKPVLEGEKNYKSIEELEKELEEALKEADAAKADMDKKNKELKDIQSELAAKVKEKESLINNREAEILKLLK